MTVKDGKADRQKNVPISETYHQELQAISLITRKPMKEIVEGYIREDGRGKIFLEKANAADKSADAEAVNADNPGTTPAL